MPEHAMSIPIGTESQPILDGSQETDRPLPIQVRDALLRKWERYLDGREKPNPVEMTRDFEDAWTELETRHGMTFAEAARWEAGLDHYCEARYPGIRVVYFQDGQSPPSVIAVGDAEVALFQEHHLDELSRRCRIRWPNSSDGGMS
jgi:hypothetical protein